MKQNLNNFPCICDHGKKNHTENAYYKNKISSCNACVKSHWYLFTPDNLKYLEKIYEKTLTSSPKI